MLKFTKVIFLSVLSLSFTTLFSAHSSPFEGMPMACQMSNLKIEKSACSAEKTFYVVINFTHSDNSECFNLSGNGKQYGQFKYSQLPLKITGLKGDCTTEYEFVIKDCANENCNIVGILGKVCCETPPCSLSDLSLVKSDCNADGNFYVTINFLYKNVGDCFNVHGNGVNYGNYKYNQLPLKIGPLKGDCKTSFEFGINDCNNEKCSISKELGLVCCETMGDCKLYDLEFTKSECDPKGQYYLKIHFKYQNTSDSFNIKDSLGKPYGRFAFAKMPVLVGPFNSDCKTNLELIISDYTNEKCLLKKDIGIICCETQNGDCKLSELKVEKSTCNENKEFFVTLNFNHVNTSECFTVQGNGVNYSTFNYANLPIKIGPLKGNCETNYEFVIKDCKKDGCSLSAQLGKVCCETQNGDCKLSELKIEKTPCNENKEFYVYLNFNHVNTSECFTVQGNGINYGTFNYTNLPIKIGPLKGNCETNYEFGIKDCKNEGCSLSGTLGKVCCETQNGDCKLSDLKIEKSACNENKEFFVTLNFNHVNTSECFTVQGNGVNYGTFNYSSLPIKIGPLKGNCETNYEFAIKDCTKDGCSLSGQLGKVCCETQNGDCKLSELKIEKTPCNENKDFFVYLNFNHVNTSECFTVQGNGINYGTFNYATLPIKIGPLKGNCETNYEFVIKDCKNEGCSLSGQLGKVCCETQNGDCKLSELKIEKTPCNENKEFYVYLNFNHVNTSECFTVQGNGVNYGTFNYANLPIKIGPLKGNCETNYEFGIKDCKNEGCSLSGTLGKVCCEAQNGDCILSDLNIEKTSCNDKKQFTVVINFAHKNTSGCFMVFGNGINYGTFDYSQLPIKIGPLTGNCETNYEFVIRDCENEKCSIGKSIGKVCCEVAPTDCQISNLEVVKGDCNAEGLFYVKINFKYQNVSECFVVKQNNNNLGKFKYSSLPLQLGPFKGNCSTNYIFTVYDCLNEKCYLRKELGRVCCKNTTNCMLSELKYEKTACNSEKQFYLSIKFAYKNTSECFTVTGNGVNYGTFKYGSLPIKLGPLKGDCSTNYEFVIRDCKNERCNLTLNLGKVCCETQGADCKIYDLVVKALECTGKGQYAIKIDFKYQGTKGVGFDVFDRAGNSIGFYPYSSLPLTIKDFKASGNDFDYIKVCENDNENCCAAAEFKSLNCLLNPPGTFNMKEVEILTGSNQILIHSLYDFPENFNYHITDINGRAIATNELSRTSHYININTSEMLGGIYIINMQNSNDLRNMKFIKSN